MIQVKLSSLSRGKDRLTIVREGTIEIRDQLKRVPPTSQIQVVSTSLKARRNASTRLARK